jgi:hypothetical protein
MEALFILEIPQVHRRVISSSPKELLFNVQARTTASSFVVRK